MNNVDVKYRAGTPAHRSAAGFLTAAILHSFVNSIHATRFPGERGPSETSAIANYLIACGTTRT